MFLTELNDGYGSAVGKLKEIDKFDSSFFSTMVMLADAMDPQARIILETTYEAIADAGIFPHSLRGSKTGVYVGINTVGESFYFIHIQIRISNCNSIDT